MKSFYNTIILLLGISVVGGIAVLLVIASQYLFDQYESLDPQWSSAILIVSVVLLLCTFVLARAIHSLSGNKDKAIHPEKAVVYGNFIELWVRTNTLEAMDDAGETNLQNQRKQLTLWAADAVLKEYLKLEKMASTNTPGDELQIQAEKVVLEMRKDFGNRNRGILKGDLLEFLERS